MNLNKYIGKALLSFGLLTVSLHVLAQGTTPETLQSMAAKFSSPGQEYGPHVWWQWMGPNFSKEGITKDLEAMKECGIGGATIFNLTSSVQESHFPMENNPWPLQTYRSDAYWDAMEHTMKEARRLGLKIGRISSSVLCRSSAFLQLANISFRFSVDIMKASLKPVFIP